MCFIMSSWPNHSKAVYRNTCEAIFHLCNYYIFKCFVTSCFQSFRDIYYVYTRFIYITLNNHPPVDRILYDLTVDSFSFLSRGGAWIPQQKLRMDIDIYMYTYLGCFFHPQAAESDPPRSWFGTLCWEISRQRCVVAMIRWCHPGPRRRWKPWNEESFLKEICLPAAEWTKSFPMQTIWVFPHPWCFPQKLSANFWKVKVAKVLTVGCDVEDSGSGFPIKASPFFFLWSLKESREQNSIPEITRTGRSRPEVLRFVVLFRILLGCFTTPNWNRTPSNLYQQTIKGASGFIVGYGDCLL